MGTRAVHIDEYKVDATFSTDMKTVTHSQGGPTIPGCRGQWDEEKAFPKTGQGRVYVQSLVTPHSAQRDGSLNPPRKMYRAVKRISIPDAFPTENVNIARELEHLAIVTDPRHQHLFVQLICWYTDCPNDFVFIAMEYHEHGDLRGWLRNPHMQNELTAKEITRQVLEALIVLHDLNICHRDIKPSNILVASPIPIRVKLADFGISKSTQDPRGLRTQLGTTGFMAPELFQRPTPERPQLGGYTNKIDLWSLGCVVFINLTQQNPFAANFNGSYQFDVNIFRAYVQDKVPRFVDLLKERGVSECGINFIKNLIVVDAQSRLNARMAAAHLWITGSTFPVIIRIVLDMLVFSPNKRRRMTQGSKAIQLRAPESVKRYELDASFPQDKAYIEHVEKGPTGVSNGRWVKVERIARGGQGTIWKYKRVLNGVETQHIRAIKRIEVNIGESDTKSMRARRELDVLIGVQNRFQGLFVRCHGWFQDEAKNNLYIAMDFHPFGDLRAYMTKYGAQDEDVSKKFTRQILRGLVVLHSNNICHRDIKPENILIASESPLRVKIADFGISKLTDAEEGAQTIIECTGYTAPEISQCRTCSTSADMWSLGCVLFELLTSEAPNFNDNMSIEWRARALGVGNTARAFLRGLVITLPTARMSAMEALQHRWISSLDAEVRTLWYEDMRSTLDPHWGELSAAVNLHQY